LVTVNRRLSATVGVDTTPVPGPDPVVTLMPGPDDGPVLVTVTYKVAAANMSSFRDAMRRVEGHRRRTGAYRWGLFRDLADPDRFLETFVVSSWAEHLRQHQRVTTRSETHLDAVRSLIEPGHTTVAHLVSAFSAIALQEFEPYAVPVAEER
jgi:Transmembrane secretion effector